ncbi:MAG: iron ABC transporter substrate-binding protein [Dehalococcoidia bacterium]|nr:iron ABC transporter substrate-binding protein [Dehalococcoidia bacterium]HJN58809.1 iron ABC transporter substrate-binding protein [Dehalococcoidia bacterium]
MKKLNFVLLNLMIFLCVSCSSEIEIIEVVVEKEVQVEKTYDTLVIYSGRGESLIGPVIQQFSEATGIPVEVKYGKTGALAATLLEEGSKSPADIYFAQDPGGLGSVNAILSSLSEEIISLGPSWANSPDDKWVGISGRGRVVVYNNEAIKDPTTQLPDNIYDFVDPKWKDKIGWAPTNGSFQAMITGMRVIWGEDKTEQWLEGIMSNNPKVYAKNTPTVAATAAGEVEVGFVNHYYLHRFMAEEGETFAARNYFLPGGGPGSIVLVAGAGILDVSDNKDAAEAFLKFMLSPATQGYFANQTYEYPLVKGVNKSRLLPDLETLNTPQIDISDLGDLENTQELLRKVGALP